MYTAADLKKARQHVERGKLLIASQKALVEWVAERGHSTTVAETLLANMLATLAIMEEHRA